MPTYDFRCVDCQATFAIRQRMTEVHKGICPTCGGKGERVFHAVPVHYRGPGFYTTDYARKGET